MEILSNTELDARINLISTTLLSTMASRSDCLTRKVGSFLYYLPTNKVIAVGSNTLPTKFSPCLDLSACYKHNNGHCPIIHSEQNCIFNCLMKGHTDMQNTILVCTYSPCYECSKVIARLRIPKIYYLNTHHKTDFYFLKQASVICQKLNL